MRQIILIKNEITPIFIFDGDKLPMKNNEEDKREIKRKENEKEFENMLKINNIFGAICKKIESFDVTPEFAYEFIKILKYNDIEYYVAPYEADAQLAYLSYINYVDFIITEDSDLLAYGCHCVLFKLGSLKNESLDVGEEILYENIEKCKEIRFKNFSKDKFLNFCILCGCDYLKIPGVGPKLSNEALNKYDDYNNFLGYIFSKICIQGSILNTIEQYEKSFLTFRYQVVYCPKEKKLKYFHNINENRYHFLNKYKNNLSFLGKTEFENINLDDYIQGLINPITKENLDQNNNKYCMSQNIYELCFLNQNKTNKNNIQEYEKKAENELNYLNKEGKLMTQFNFYHKRTKNNDKKQKKNIKSKNQTDIESFLSGKNNKFKIIKTTENINNIINMNFTTNENINNNEDEKIIKDINDENCVNSNFFDKYIFDSQNMDNKRTSQDLNTIIKNNNHTKNFTNSDLCISSKELSFCFNPLTRHSKTKTKNNIISKQKQCIKNLI